MNGLLHDAPSEHSIHCACDRDRAPLTVTCLSCGGPLIVENGATRAGGSEVLLLMRCQVQPNHSYELICHLRNRHVTHGNRA